MLNKTLKNLKKSYSEMMWNPMIMDSVVIGPHFMTLVGYKRYKLDKRHLRKNTIVKIHDYLGGHKFVNTNDII